MATRRRSKNKAIDWRTVAWRSIIWGSVLLAVVWSAGVFIASPLPKNISSFVDEEIEDLNEDAGLVVENVIVKGRIYTNADKLRGAINAEVGDVMIDFDMEGARTRILKLPWVDSALIERRWPNTIYVLLVEKVPIARWKAYSGDKVFVISSDGKIITKQTAELSALPLVVGVNANESADDLLRLLASLPSIKHRLIKATRISSRRWDLLLSGNVLIKLPPTDEGLAIERIIKQQAKSKILDTQNQYIDARKADRLIVGKL